MWVGDKAGVDFGFFLEDVEAAGEDFPTIERLDKRVFVHHGAARCVDDHDALLHELEFFGGDYVAGLFLGRVRYASYWSVQ